MDSNKRRPSIVLLMRRSFGIWKNGKMEDPLVKKQGNPSTGTKHRQANGDKKNK